MVIDMNILVVGCGTVGSQLATTLCREGHVVSVIDRLEESFSQLGNDFTGLTVTGVPIDQETLRKAGIESCDALAAVTSNDNINVMVSQLAKEIFSVPKVLTRIYDPRRQQVFSQFGLMTICPTLLTVDSAISMLTDREQVRYVNFGAASMSLTTAVVAKQYDGYLLSKVPFSEGEVPVGVIHSDGKLTVVEPNSKTVVYATEQVVLAKSMG